MAAGLESLGRDPYPLSSGLANCAVPERCGWSSSAGAHPATMARHLPGLGILGRVLPGGQMGRSTMGQIWGP